MNGANPRLRVPRGAERQQSRPAGRRRPGRGRRRDRQGDHRRLSLLGRQRLLDPHREHDRAGAFPALGRRRAGSKAGRCSACSSASCPAPTCRRASTASSAPHGFIGPKRSPLGLAADPGGFPLYKNGVVVGGVGVMADGVYGFDPEIQDVDQDDEEAIALAATHRLRRRRARSAPTGSASTAPRLRFSDATAGRSAHQPGRRAAPSRTPRRRAGALIAVSGYYDSATASSPAAPTAPKPRASAPRPPPNSPIPTPSSSPTARARTAIRSAPAPTPPAPR